MRSDIKKTFLLLERRIHFWINFEEHCRIFREENKLPNAPISYQIIGWRQQENERLKISKELNNLLQIITVKYIGSETEENKWSISGRLNFAIPNSRTLFWQLHFFTTVEDPDIYVGLSFELKKMNKEGWIYNCLRWHYDKDEFALPKNDLCKFKEDCHIQEMNDKEIQLFFVCCIPIDMNFFTPRLKIPFFLHKENVTKYQIFPTSSNDEPFRYTEEFTEDDDDDPLDFFGFGYGENTSQSQNLE